MKYTWFLALRYLCPPRRKLFSLLTMYIAVAGIAIGVAALVVTLGIMTGFHREIRSRIMMMYPHVMVSGRATLDENILEDIPGIVARAPFLYSHVILKKGNNVNTTVVKGVDFEREQRVVGIARTFLKREGPGLSTGTVFVGKELAKNMDLDVGDTVVMILPTQTATPFGMLPNTQKLRVAGVFSSGIYEYDSNLCFIDFNQARALFFDDATGSLNAVTGYGLRLSSDRVIPDVMQRLRAQLGYLFRVLSWEQMNYNLFSALKLERVVMIVVVGLIIIVACFIILSNMLFMGIQKSRDIGILMSMGASRGEIARIFLFQGVFLNFTGIVSGTALGLLLCHLVRTYQFIRLPQDVYYIDRVPVHIAGGDLAIVLCIAVLVGFLASLYPARRVAQFDPIEIIRYG
jgi:lipoprotein-releasing system permease protein